MYLLPPTHDAARVARFRFVDASSRGPNKAWSCCRVALGFLLGNSQGPKHTVAHASYFTLGTRPVGQ
eukprot:14715117-Alexandrium_andersonii.AAC.1